MFSYPRVRRSISRPRDVGIERDNGAHALGEIRNPVRELAFFLKRENSDANVRLVVINIVNVVSHGINRPLPFAPNCEERKAGVLVSTRQPPVG